MHHQHPEYDAMLARQRYNDILKEMDEARLAAQLPPRPSLLRQAAHRMGQVLIGVGTQLTQYGRTSLNEQPLIKV